jgi:uncharacterized protein YneR
MPVQFKIESIFDFANSGCFVLAQHLLPGQDFVVTEKSFLGGAEIKKNLDQPRSLDGSGQPRKDLFAFQLKNKWDKDRLDIDAVVDLVPGNHIHCLLPWYFTDLDLSVQLRRETNKNHILYGKSVKTIARRQDNDDVLFELNDTDFQYAVVHLTWSQKTLEDSHFPTTRLYKNWVEIYEDRIVNDNTGWEE